MDVCTVTSHHTHLRTRIKICGITRRQDALAAADAGADAIGLVFYPPSPRAVQTTAAAAITRGLPPFVTAVGLFVDADEGDVRRVLAEVPLNLLQFHGEEPAGYCAQFGLPYMKAIRVRAGIDLLQCASDYAGASALLLDAYRVGVPGGTGEMFDWTVVPRGLDGRLVLSGGLNSDNVVAGIAQLRPWAVDVSSGVESTPGIKDPQRIARFIAAVREADKGLAGGLQQPVRMVASTN
ncbi:MAG: phosphoribosylanthranilate isomerase [Betaproteobacteria bacterium]